MLSGQTAKVFQNWLQYFSIAFATILIICLTYATAHAQNTNTGSAPLAPAPSTPEAAQQAPPAATAESPSRQLNVVASQGAPFVIIEQDGTFRGIGIELWQTVARELALEYAITEKPLSELLSEVEASTADVGVAALTVTSGREELMDFTYPFYATGWTIAVPLVQQTSMPMAILQRIFSVDFAYAIGALALVLFAAGILMWLFERKKNEEQFGGPAKDGMGNGFWWAAVTMTTVGYGDKAPVTFGGRLVGLIWMFASVIVISSFTASIASSLTVSQLEGGIEDLQDLRQARVGTLDASASVSFLEQNGIRATGFPSVQAGLEALSQNRIDAFVHDAPILRYAIANEFPDKLTTLPSLYGEQRYAFALPTGSDLREPLNRAMLSYMESDAWLQLKRRYLPDAN